MCLRKCTHCGLEANSIDDLEMFVIRKDAEHGRRNRCKECSRKLHRDKWSKTYELKRIRPDGYKEFRASRQKTWSLKCKFGLSEEDINQKLLDANYSCEICGRKESDVYKLVFDHDHNTGVFRGILCHSCNCNLGYFEKEFKKMNKTKKTISKTFNVQKAFDYVLASKDTKV